MTYQVPEQPFDKWFEPYAVAIGFMLREWNTLQTNLGELFAALLNAKSDDLGFALWNSVRNDRQQRTMLLNGAPHVLDLNDTREKHVMIEIEFIVKKANALGVERDEFAHALEHIAVALSALDHNVEAILRKLPSR
jgi:hypothetical protein